MFFVIHMNVNYYCNDHKLLLDVQSQVRDLNATVLLLRTEILNLKSPEPPKTTSFAFGLSPSQVNTSNESSGRRNTSYTFDEPISFVPLSPPPRRKPITRAISMATL
jgi:hypothetical protein